MTEEEFSIPFDGEPASSPSFTNMDENNFDMDIDQDVSSHQQQQQQQEQPGSKINGEMTIPHDRNEEDDVGGSGVNGVSPLVDENRTNSSKQPYNAIENDSNSMNLEQSIEMAPQTEEATEDDFAAFHDSNPDIEESPTEQDAVQQSPQYQSPTSSADEGSFVSAASEENEFSDFGAFDDAQPSNDTMGMMEETTGKEQVSNDSMQLTNGSDVCGAFDDFHSSDKRFEKGNHDVAAIDDKLPSSSVTFDEPPAAPADIPENDGLQQNYDELSTTAQPSESIGDFAAFDGVLPASLEEPDTSPPAEPMATPSNESEPPSNDGDNFGDFAAFDKELPAPSPAAEEATPVQSSHREQPVSGHEERGGEEVEADAEAEEGKELDSNDEDGFGDFEAFDKELPAPSVSTEEATPVQSSRIEPPESEHIEGKKETETNETAESPNETNDGFGEFTAFDEAPSAETNVEKQMNKTSDQTKEIGHGDNATSEETPPAATEPDATAPIEEPQTDQPQPNLDETTTPVQPSTTEHDTSAGKQSECETAEETEESFGDFAAFDDALPAPSSTSEPDTSPIEQPKHDQFQRSSPDEATSSQPRSEERAGSDDDRSATQTPNENDFAAFSKAPPPISKSQQSSLPQNETNDDNFGAFDETASEPIKDRPLNESQEEEDDFGDFAAFDASSAEAAPEEPPEEKQSRRDSSGDPTEEFDEFGTFDEAAPHPPSSDEDLTKTEMQQEAEEEFGDFGTSEEAPPSTDEHKNDHAAQSESRPQMEPQQQHVEDSQPLDDDDDDFGDFGSFDEADLTQTNENAVDPFLREATTILREVFHPPESKDGEQQTATPTQSYIPVTVKSVLSSIPPTKQPSDKWSATTLSASLFSDAEILGCDPPGIVLVDTKHTFHLDDDTHEEIDLGPSFTPTSSRGGQPASFNMIEEEPKRHDEVVNAIDAFRQNAVVNGDHSNQKPPTTTNVAKLATVGEDEPISKKTSTTTNDNHSDCNDTYRQFLDRIPDLSFMLQSTLCLPKQTSEQVSKTTLKDPPTFNAFGL